MAKLTLELGATINTGEYSNVRPLIRITDIDSSLDVKEQVLSNLRAAVEAFPLMDEELAGIAEELVTGTPGRDGLRARIEQMEKNVATNAGNIATVFGKVKNELMPQIEDLVKRLEAAPKKAGKKAETPDPADIPTPLEVTLVEEDDEDG